MKKLVIIFSLFSLTLFSQNNQLQIEADVANGPERASILQHNVDNGTKGFTSIQQFAGTGSNQSIGSFITYNNSYNAIPDFHGYISILSGSNSLHGRGINLIGQKSNSNIRFYLGGYLSSDMKMILSSSGNLGLGTTTPDSKLHIANGDVYIEDVSNGVIMKSPNGTCWRMQIDNAGTVTTTQLTVCP